MDPKRAVAEEEEEGWSPPPPPRREERDEEEEERLMTMPVPKGLRRRQTPPLLEITDDDDGGDDAEAKKWLGRQRRREAEAEDEEDDDADDLETMNAIDGRMGEEISSVIAARYTVLAWGENLIVLIKEVRVRIVRYCFIWCVVNVSFGVSASSIGDRSASLCRVRAFVSKRAKKFTAPAICFIKNYYSIPIRVYDSTVLAALWGGLCPT